MRDQGQLFFATNKEIHDLLYSAKQKLTESVLQELLRDRGILCSTRDTRESLVEYISMLTHDYGDVCGILEKREASRRGERAATVTLSAELTSDELKHIVSEYQKDEVREQVSSYKKSESEFVMKVTYLEFDYSKTRLLQRQERDAEIIFNQANGVTEIRMPATDRSRAIVDKIKAYVEAAKKQVIPLQEIELTSLSTEQRTLFFTKLISSMSGFQLETVSRVRVAHLGVSPSDNLEEEGTEDVEEELLGIVESVAMSGENLVASEMYQELRDKGFYVTSITWRAKQATNPFAKIECDAGFEDGAAGRKFRYSVHGVFRFNAGKYTKNLRPISEGEKAELLSIIESTARAVFASLTFGETQV